MTFELKTDAPQGHGFDLNQVSSDNMTSVTSWWSDDKLVVSGNTKLGFA